MPNANSYQSGAAAMSVVSLYGISLARRPPFALLLQGVRQSTPLLFVSHKSRNENILMRLTCPDMGQVEDTEVESKCSTKVENQNETRALVGRRSKLQICD